MLRHREQVLAHAEEQLALEGRRSREDLLTLYKRFLKIENHRLRLKHYSGGGGLDIARQRANLMDVVLSHLFDAALKLTMDGARPPSLALVATGGYGRGELNPFSDVDIMFLHETALREISPQLNAMIEMILYTLWDVGFKVGHATRSVAGAIRHANADMLSKTALLESRHIAGSKPLFDQFKTDFEQRCVRGYEHRYIEARIHDQAARHAKHGSTVYMQEPNIKNGCGGLRDYQNLIWIGHFKEHIDSTAELVARKFLQENERRKLDRAYDFLMRARTELHYLNNRAADAISLNFQTEAATKLGYRTENALRRTEEFMRDYYRHARNIYFITELLSERFHLDREFGRQPSRLLSFFSARPKEEHFDGFSSSGGVLHPEKPEVFDEEPFRLLRVFRHAQERKLVLSAELQQLIRRRLQLVHRTFQYARAAREVFFEILSHKGQAARILRSMHELDILGRFIPEFGQLTALVQHEFFHRYTADEHTLVCIEKLDELLTTENPKLARYRTLFEKLEDPIVLYLALLLHDSGKASNARHHAEASAVDADRVARRLQLTSEQRRSLTMLVDHHLTLSNTAQRRNLDDPTTIAEFAAVVKNQANLDALMLLTLVDGQGTGDESWSDWKESLVWELHRTTSQFLAEGEAFYHRRRMEIETLRVRATATLPPDFEEEIDAHFQYMPEIYFQTCRAEEVAGHLRLVRDWLRLHLASDDDALAPVLRWQPWPESGHTELWVCTWDRRQLLARIAGALAVSGLSILGADIFSRGDNIVLDVFRVCDTRFRAVTDPKEFSHVERSLRQALAVEEYDFRPLLNKLLRRPRYHLAQEITFPTRIAVDNRAHPTYTLVELVTPDRLGLLYNVLKAFGEVDVNIVLSRIATQKGAAIDSFYVSDMEGHKLRDGEPVRRLQDALHKAAAAAALG